MTPPLQICVVGAGVMGTNHMRVYSELKDVELVAVFDNDPVRSAAAAERFSCQALDSLEAVADVAEAVSIAVSTSAHAEVAGPLLEAGVHCLIEKPLAATEAECSALLSAAHTGGAALLVGHIERFNPAVRQLARIVSSGESIRVLDARRLNAVTRVVDVDVVLDLMVHDIDIVIDLMAGLPTSITAQGVPNPGGGFDYVTALLEFSSGAMAVISASRITQNKIRTLEVSTESRWFTLDYSSQELLIWTRGSLESVGGEPLGSSEYVLEAKTERVYVRGAEPLAMELRHFADVVQKGVPPLIGGADALNALRVAWAIQEQLAN